MFYCFLHAGDGRVAWAPDESLLKTETVQQHAIYWNKTHLVFSADVGRLLFQYEMMTSFWSNECDLCMKIHHLLFHGILSSVFIFLNFFLIYQQNTNRYEEVLRSVYSEETMHAIGGGLGYLWM